MEEPYHLSFNVGTADNLEKRKDIDVNCFSYQKLSWGRQKEDKVKLEDVLTQGEEALRRVKAKQSLSVKKVHLARSIRYVDLALQESDSFYPNMGEMLNPAFVGDQAS